MPKWIVGSMMFVVSPLGTGNAWAVNPTMDDCGQYDGPSAYSTSGVCDTGEFKCVLSLGSYTVTCTPYNGGSSSVEIYAVTHYGTSSAEISIFGLDPESDPVCCVIEDPDALMTVVQIWGGEYDDEISFNYSEGDDFYYLDAYGDDTLKGYIVGDQGDDTIDGSNSDGEKYEDHLYGGDDSDTISLNDGNADEAWGGNGIDYIYGGTSDNTLIEGEGGNDYLYGSTGDDEIRGGSGNDVINEFTGDDLLYGESGSDTLCDHSGNDLFDGGGGFLPDKFWAYYPYVTGSRTGQNPGLRSTCGNSSYGNWVPTLTCNLSTKPTGCVY